MTIFITQPKQRIMNMFLIFGIAKTFLVHDVHMINSTTNQIHTLGF
ncbi:MAG: hypothetical protein ACKPKO_46480 [Candidatus Fonsibacter sp.]